ncbi:MAG: T9SS type B sorting domain-containing protein [Crocinitomix sp.]|nr:T9SS type B sorting domain-containing protein [Crocinitomix sp.]
MKAQTKLPVRGLKSFLTISTLLIAATLFSQDTYSDTLNCDGGTPTFIVDLEGAPDSLWVSDPASRDGSCCFPPDDNCVQFSLTLDSTATGIIFYIPDGCGASPTGALFYQVDCGPLTSVGTALCLDGPGPYTITFCKPGNNENCYSIKSISAPKESDDITITDACLDSLWITGLDEPTITWTSIFPGEIGEYDYLLDCTEGCDTVIVEADPGGYYPELVKFQVCGVSLGGCAGDPHCDTLAVAIVPSLEVMIEPEEPTICFGGTGVDLGAIAIGGAEPYTYTWNTSDTTAGIFVTEPGIYFVEIGDGTGCAIAYDTVEVTEYDALITADAGPDITICALPSPTVDLTGLITGSTTAIWSGGAGVFDADETDLTPTYTPSDYELESGSATLILTTTDNGSCPGGEDTITIYFPKFTTDVTAIPENVDCFGNATGAIDVLATGGALPLTYEWDTGDLTEDLEGLIVGEYALIMTDDNGCTDSLMITILEPEALEEWAILENISCYDFEDGGIDLTVTGGTIAYSFEWDTGEITEDIAGVGAGLYAFTITDANGCLLAGEYELTQPTDLIFEHTVTAVSCNGFADGSVDVTLIGGVPGYIFNWDTGDLTEDITGLIVGTYNLTATDENGCEKSLSVLINEPEELELTAEIIDVLCFGEATGSIDVSVLGGTPDYYYTWSTGEISEDVTGLVAGTYLLEVVDANGCIQDESFSITQPDILTADFIIENIACFGDSTGTIDLSVSGGIGVYEYLWSNGEVLEDIATLEADIYTVTITDENGCELIAATTLTEPTALDASIEGTDVTCIDAADGIADLTVVGGIPPYTFEWDTGDVTITEEDLIDMEAGIYYIEITDDNGCLLSDSISIAEPIDFDAGPDTNLVACSNDGIIDLSEFLFATATGAWSEVTTSGQFNPITGEFDLNDLPSGVYVFNYVIPVFTPCTDTLAQFIVVVHPIPAVIFDADEVMGCAPLKTSFSNLTAYEGSSCVWNMGDGTIIEECGSFYHSYEYPGSYDVSLEITTEYGCSNFFTAESFITIFEGPEAAFTSTPDFPSIQDPEVEFTNLSYNAVAYNWNFGDGSSESTVENPYHLFPDTGNESYRVCLIAYSDMGCTDTAHQIIKVEDVLLFYVPNAFTPDGDDYNNDFRPIMTSGYDVYDYHLRIFNRWGETVFESMNAEYGWDGTYGNNGLVKDDVYIWTLDFSETMSSKRHTHTGHVTVLK